MTDTPIPCYLCPDRAVGCHGRCERYAAFCRRRDAARAARRRDTDAADARREGNRRCKGGLPRKQNKHQRR